MWVKSNLLCAKSNLLSANLFFNLLIYKDLRAVFFTQRVSKRLKDIYSPCASAPGECSIKINKQLGGVVLRKLYSVTQHTQHKPPDLPHSLLK